MPEVRRHVMCGSVYDGNNNAHDRHRGMCDRNGSDPDTNVGSYDSIRDVCEMENDASEGNVSGITLCLIGASLHLLRVAVHMI